MSDGDLFLEVMVAGGAGVESICEQAAQLAARLGIAVVFEFSGTRQFAFPGDSPEALSASLSEAISKGRPYA